MTNKEFQKYYNSNMSENSCVCCFRMFRGIEGCYISGQFGNCENFIRVADIEQAKINYEKINKKFKESV